MLTAIIVEDEDKARQNLLALLAEYCENVQVPDTAANVKDALVAIEKHSPDVLFLDVKMQGETGFDLLEQIENIDFEIIFTTAHNEYALKAFKFSAVDYLLKPISIDELVNAVKRVEEKKEAGTSHENIKNLLDNLKGAKTFSKIALPTMEGLFFVQVDEVIRFESDESYTYIYLTNKKRVMVSRNIKYFDDLLTEHDFFRVHRSHLINLNHIQKYYKGEGGYLIMADDSEVLVSRRKREEFLNIFSKQ